MKAYILISNSGELKVLGVFRFLEHLIMFINNQQQLLKDIQMYQDFIFCEVWDLEREEKLEIIRPIEYIDETGLMRATTEGEPFKVSVADGYDVEVKNDYNC